MKKLSAIILFIVSLTFCGLAQDSAKVEMPNVFTPNNDGVNDVFRPTYVGVKNVSGYIYNRWGEVIYQWWGIKGYWDGYTFPAGVAVPEGTYYYVVKAYSYTEEEIIKTGVVSLKR